MVDSRAKGVRGEYLVRDILREHTDHQFERIPASGALAYLKGDLWVPHENNRFCIEVKNYAESPLTDKIFTQQKTNNLIRWWRKVVIQAKGMEQEPLLFFKYNRSKVFVVTALKPKNTDDYMHLPWLGCYAMLAEKWLELENEDFLNV
jgi:Holliday junction resolvase